jgi:hypothetical protein
VQSSDAEGSICIVVYGVAVCLYCAFIYAFTHIGGVYASLCQCVLHCFKFGFRRSLCVSYRSDVLYCA